MNEKIRKSYLILFILCIVSLILNWLGLVYVDMGLELVLFILSIYILVKQEKGKEKLVPILMILSFILYVTSTFMVVYWNGDSSMIMSIFFLSMFSFCSRILRFLGAVFSFRKFKNIND